MKRIIRTEEQSRQIIEKAKQYLEEQDLDEDKEKELFEVFKHSYAPKRTKNIDNYGISTLFSFPKEKLTEEFVNGLLEILEDKWDVTYYDKEGTLCFNEELFKECLEHGKKFFFQKRERVGFWRTFKKPPTKIAYCVLASWFNRSIQLHDYIFQYNQNQILGFNVEDQDNTGIRVDNLEKVNHYLNLMKSIFDYIQPEFGWSDHFDYLLKVQGKNPTKEIFGINYYGKEMVNNIGKDKLLSSPIYKVIESDWGGIILQFAENPFILDININNRKKMIKKIKEYLGFI